MAMETIGLGGKLVFDDRQATDAMGRASGAFGGLQKKSRGAGDALGQFAVAARNAALAATAVGVGLGFAIRDAREFGKAVGEVSTIADEAEFPLERIGKISKELAVQYGVMPVEQAKAMYQAISAGATTAAEATGLLHTANMLAIGGVSDSFTAMDVLTTAVNSYSAAGLGAADASDVIFKTVALGKTTVDELGASLGNVIPAAAGLNVSFAELGAAMATITVGGISTAEASTALNAALMGIRKPSEEAKKAAKRLGIDFSATALKSKDLATVLGEAAEAAKGDDEAITALFGSVRGLKAISVLTANEGKKFNEALSAMEGRAGATEEAFDKMSKTTDFQLNRMAALGKASTTTLGEILEPLAIKVLAPLGRMAEKLFEILEAVRSKDFDELGGRASLIAKGVADAIDSIDKGITTAIDNFKELGRAIGTSFGVESLRSIAKHATLFAFMTVIMGPLALGILGVGFAMKTMLFLGAPVLKFFKLLGPILTYMSVTTIPMALVQLKALALHLGWVTAMAWSNVLAFLAVAAPILIVVAALGLFIAFMEATRLENETMMESFVKNFQAGMREIGRYITELGLTIFRVLISPFQKVASGIALVVEAAGGKAKGLRAFAEAKFEAPKEARFLAVEERPGAGRLMPPPRAARRGLGARLAGEEPPTVVDGGELLRGLEAQIGEISKGQIEQMNEMTKQMVGMMEDTKTTAEKAAEAAASADKAARRKPCAKVEIDKREVGRAVAKHQDEVKTRSGFKATPYQRRQIVENGVI